MLWMCPPLPKLRFQPSRHYMGLLKEWKEETTGGAEAHTLGRPVWDKSLHSAAPQLPQL